MDPLSISVAAASLAAAAGKVSVWLYDVIQKTRNVDAAITELATEVSSLVGVLNSVHKTLQKCQSQTLTLAYLDDDIWENIDRSMLDCKLAVEDLEKMIEEIRNNSGSRRLLRKPNMQLQLSLRTTEISGFKEKIYKSNTAMQTALATVTVSLSLRSNTSQDRIFSELQLLTTTIQQALKAAGLSQSPNDQLAARQSRNLHNLAKAAQKFHSSASSTASTMYGRTHPAYAPVPAWSSLYGTQLPNNDPRYIYGMTMPMPMPMGPGGPAVYPNLGSYVSGPPPDMHYAQEAHRLGVLNQMMPAPHLMPPQRQWTGDSGWAGGSEIGGLDSAQRDRIERWNQSSTTFGGTNDNLTAMASTPATHYSAIFSEGQDVDESDSDIELDILRNFEELAKTSFFKENYGKAEQFLRKAIERLTGESSSSPKFRTLMLQLALSCALQEKWDAAASILTTFKKPTSTADVPVLCLFQAVALGYLQSDKLEESYQACKTALQGKKKLCGKESEEYFDCLALLAKICDAKGDEFEAEAVRHSIPPAVPIQIPSGGKSYVEANISKFFIFFLESSDDSPRAELRSPTDEDISRLSLIRRDGISCADANDRSGKQIGESDTGKEMTVVVGPPAAPLRDFPEPRKANPSDYSNIREGELDSGKELVMPNSTGPTTQSQSQIVIRHELDASHPSAVPQVPDQRPTPINPRTWILSSDVVSNVIAVGIALTVSNVTFADYVGSSPVGGGQIYVSLHCSDPDERFEWIRQFLQWSRPQLNQPPTSEEAPWPECTWPMLKIVQANFSGHAAPGYKRYGDSKLAMEFNHSVQNIEAGLFSWLTTRRAHGISLASMPKDTYLAVPDVVACRDPTDIALAFAGASIQREETKRVRVISQTAAALCYYAKSSLLPQRGRFSAPKTVVVMLVDDLLVETRAYAVQYYENTDSLGFTAVGSDVIVSEFSGSISTAFELFADVHQTLKWRARRHVGPEVIEAAAISVVKQLIEAYSSSPNPSPDRTLTGSVPSDILGESFVHYPISQIQHFIFQTIDHLREIAIDSIFSVHSTECPVSHLLFAGTCLGLEDLRIALRTALDELLPDVEFLVADETAVASGVVSYGMHGTPTVGYTGSLLPLAAIQYT